MNEKTDMHIFVWRLAIQCARLHSYLKETKKKINIQLLDVYANVHEQCEICSCKWKTLLK